MENSAQLNKYLLEQRTELSLLHSLRLLRSITKRIKPLGKIFLNLEARLRPTEQLIYLMEKELDIYMEYLTQNCAFNSRKMTVLDIGSGLGIQSGLIQKFFPNSNHRFYFVDTSGTSDELYYDYNTVGAFYNSFDLSKKLVNDVYNINIGNITFIDFRKTYVYEHLPKADFIHSLISCGYHYPVNQYADIFLDKLIKCGDLIIDIRQGIDLGVLSSSEFRLVNRVSSHQNYDRLHFRKT